jgi:hypothetical protein
MYGHSSKLVGIYLCAIPEFHFVPNCIPALTNIYYIHVSEHIHVSFSRSMPALLNFLVEHCVP